MKSRSRQPYSSSPFATSELAAPFSPELLGWLRDAIAEYCGVYFDNARLSALEAGLAQRLQATNDDRAAYERRLRGQGGRDELRQLTELVLNHETSFFRNLPHLRALREVILPELHRRKPAGAPIRMWSAGCASGEEAYSLAICALEALGPTPQRPIEIWATDLSAAALQRAQAGVYRGRSLGNLTPELLARYFRPEGDAYLVSEQLRGLVRFEARNLLDPFPGTVHTLDMIFCQNVTIYFQLETCRKLIERFYHCLPEGGMLFLGFSETLWNIFDRFVSREVAGAYVYYKESIKVAQPDRRSLSTVRTTKPADCTNDSTQGVSRYDRRSFIDQRPHTSVLEQGAQTALQQGRELLQNGQIAGAIDALRGILPQSASAQQALTLIAHAHADRGDLDLAMAEIHRALEIDVLNEEAYYLLGVIYSRQERWQLAVQQFERARYLNPDLTLVSFHLAEAYRQSGHATLAAREFRNALRKLDNHPPGALLDGVAVEWLRETCRRHLESLSHM